MKRYISKTVAIITAGVLVLLVTYQCYAAFSKRALIQKNVRKSVALRDKANTNDLASPARDEAKYSGSVFDAWSKLSSSRSLDAWDFYPDHPLP